MVFEIKVFSALKVPQAFIVASILATNLFSTSALAGLSCEDLFLSQAAVTRPADLASSIVFRDGALARPDSRNRYEVQRPLVEYLIEFKDPGIGLLEFLDRLTGSDQIVDFGSGEGFAAQAFLESPQKFFDDSMNSKRNRERIEERGRLTDHQEYLRMNFDYQSGRVLEPHEPGARPTSPYFDADYAGFWRRFFDFLGRPLQERPNVLGITYEMHRETPDVHKLSYLKGRLLEQIPREELPMFDLGFSYYGILSYTKDLTGSLQRIVEKMKPGARVYVFGEFSSIIGKDVVYSADHGARSGISLEIWIERKVRGLRVIGSHSPGVFVIERTEEPLEIPKVVFDHQEGKSERPPHHVFREVE